MLFSCFRSIRCWSRGMFWGSFQWILMCVLETGWRRLRCPSVRTLVLLLEYGTYSSDRRITSDSPSCSGRSVKLRLIVKRLQKFIVIGWAILKLSGADENKSKVYLCTAVNILVRKSLTTSDIWNNLNNEDRRARVHSMTLWKLRK